MKKNLDIREERGLILTIGGTYEPMVFSILKFEPRYVVFVCSQETVDFTTTIKQEIARLRPDLKITYEYSPIIEDPSSLVEAYNSVREGLERLRRRNLLKENIRIDYTGGTKTMSAGAVLAAAPEGYKFLYVSGTERTKGGVGVVVTGKEKLVLPPNPWIVLEIESLRDLFTFVSFYEWDAALEICSTVKNRSDESDVPLFKALEKCIIGLKLWDRFMHKRALNFWKNNLPGELMRMAKVAKRYNIVSFAEKCVRMFPDLISINQMLEIEDLSESQKKNLEKKDPVVLDILANAERRSERGQYDEAALRIYRGLELYVRRRLKIFYDIDNSDVPKDVLDKTGMKNVYLSYDGKYKLGLTQSAELLMRLGDSMGEKIYKAFPVNKNDKDTESKVIIDIETRNRNWLIHGEGHVEEYQYQKLKENIKRILNIDHIKMWPDFREI